MLSRSGRGGTNAPPTVDTMAAARMDVNSPSRRSAERKIPTSIESTRAAETMESHRAESCAGAFCAAALVAKNAAVANPPTEVLHPRVMRAPRPGARRPPRKSATPTRFRPTTTPEIFAAKVSQLVTSMIGKIESTT